MRASELEAEQGATLEERRLRIEKADRLLVGAIALRLQEVAEIQRWKRAHRVPGEDRAQERQVLRRARYWALANGIAPEIVEQVLLLLVREGKRLHMERATLGEEERLRLRVRPARAGSTAVRGRETRA